MSRTGIPRAIFVAVDARDVDGRFKAGILPIDSPKDASFTTRVDVDQGPALTLKIDEIRKTLKPFQSKLFHWLRRNQANTRAYVRDPLGSLKQAGIELDQDTLEKLRIIGTELGQP